MIFGSFSDCFHFHTANMFAVHLSLYAGCHLIASPKMSLFGTIYSVISLVRLNTERDFFCYFRLNNFGCRTFGASLKATIILLPKNTFVSTNLVVARKTELVMPQEVVSKVNYILRHYPASVRLRDKTKLNKYLKDLYFYSVYRFCRAVVSNSIPGGPQLCRV